MVATLPRSIQVQTRRPFNPQSSKLTHLVAELDEKFSTFEDLMKLANTSEDVQGIALELQKLLLENQPVLKKAGKYDLLVQQLITFCAIANVTLVAVKGVQPAKVTPTSSVEISPIPKIEQVERLQGKDNTPAFVKKDTQVSGSVLDQKITSLEELRKLFATAQSPGSVAVGVAEGNYDIKGNRRKNWYGHTDPGDNAKNKGFCSIAPGRGDHFNGGTPEEADAACITMLQGKIDKVFSEFQSAGADLTLEYVINALDLYNQASPDVSRRFPKRIVEYSSRASGIDLIANARTAAFYKGDRNTATGLLSICRRENRPVSDWECVKQDQMRRAREIRRSLSSLSLTPSLPAVTVQPDRKIFQGLTSRVNSWFSKSEQKYSADAIIKHMERQGYEISRHPNEVNIVHLRNGSLARDRFEDWRVIIQFDDTGRPRIAGQWEETTKPGLYVVQNTKRRGGAITISPGQWSYQVGYHYGSTGRHMHEALVQVSPIKGLRDSNRDGVPDTPDRGQFDVNIHGPWSDATNNRVVDRSAGCLVTRTMKGHQESMQMIKRDRRYIENPKHIFRVTVINTSDLEGSK